MPRRDFVLRRNKASPVDRAVRQRRTERAHTNRKPSADVCVASSYSQMTHTLAHHTNADLLAEPLHSNNSPAEAKAPQPQLLLRPRLRLRLRRRLQPWPRPWPRPCPSSGPSSGSVPGSSPKILSEHSGPGPSRRNRSADALRVGVTTETSRSALSPLTNSLLEQLEARIKELKAWLRDTELLIFNSCLRQDKDATAQLGSFKSLCSEIRARRRGVSSVLKLCQKLLQQSQPGPLVEVGPEAEQHQEALQLLSINLERRWEAIVMQALQWQNRLKRELGEQQVPGNFLEPGLVDLHQLSPVPAGPTGLSTDDSWEWDETDMTITESEPQEAPEPEEPDLTLNLPMELDPPSDGGHQRSRTSTVNDPPNNNNVYQVYSLHNVELYRQPQFPCSSLMHKNKTGKRKLLLKSLSKDSSFSSIESLPDLLGGLMQGRGSGRRSGQSASSRRSGSESGIDTGDAETITTNSEIQGEEEDQEGEEERKDVTQHHQMIEENLKEKVWRRPRRGGGEAVEILINGRGILTPADSDSDFETGGPSVNSSKLLKQVDQYNFEGLATPPDLHQASSPVLSQGSSLESLLALGVELFPNSKEVLHRSTSLETCLVPGRSPEGEAGGGTMGSLGEMDLTQNEDQDQMKKQQGEPSSGELSRRTLDLLKRLENIQSPLTAKMTRSVSDMTLQSCSPQRLPASPSLGGRHAPLSGISRKGPPSLINESSATASLTELSSTEDSSLGSEDFTKNQRHLFLDPANANSYRRKHGNSRAGPEEADAASLSMVVNVSACTDEDEDDSDLLSSSTLTLTEEELGVRDGEDEEEERLSGASSANDEDDDEDDMEGSYILGLEYMKRELQGWIRAPRTSSSSSKTEAGLRDELQCGTFTTSSQNKEQPCFMSRSPPKFTETTVGNKTKSKEEEEEENRRNATRSYMSQFVDDVENGNVDQSCLKGKDEDDELLREESSVFTKKGEALRESYLFGKAGVCDVNDFIATTESTKPHERLPFLTKRSSSLVGQLRGELPCHSPALPSPPSLSPVEDCRSHDALCSGKPATGGRKAITIQEKFKFSSIVTEETKREVRDKKSSLPPKKRHHSHPSCCSHLPSASSFRPIEAEETKKENVHDFVMEIIDMTSLALKSKENQSEEPNQAESNPDQSSAPLTQIRDKVLEHSHRPLHLRKGDFYNYLSLSSHDSDCGEVVQCSEEKGSTPAPYAIPSYTSPSPSPDVFAAAPPTPRFRNAFSGLELDTEKHKEEAGPSPAASPPPSPDIRDEETLFSACTEEVYLGPPLCYSMALPKKPRRDLGFSEPELDGIGLKPIEYLSPDGGERRSYHNQKSPPSPVDYTSLSNLRRPPPLDARRGEDPYLGGEGLAAAAAGAGVGREQRSGNEGPPYLNPPARVAPIDSSAAQCLADTKALESNMGAVMTKISVCSAATNPSKEPAATATRINPKINCSAMREADTVEGERRGEAKGRRGRRESQQETTTKQVSVESDPLSRTLYRALIAHFTSLLQVLVQAELIVHFTSLLQVLVRTELIVHFTSLLQALVRAEPIAHFTSLLQVLV
ncbi:A-kinase anchor protein 6-like [Sphaeramia orbicularis]|uniref:A-kinase anchor protein 6-like n=1 Tax=Sphaeramia orbicularis TaxID=375764 RepID=UPI00117CB572|nr:A-kinase anchor protein 6-like [Sphaeramia orbicularis]